MTQPFTIRLDPNRRITDVQRVIHGTADQLATAGGQLAADHAARLTGTDWKMAAEVIALCIIRQRGTAQCSDIREEVKGTNLDVDGMDARAWGAVFR